MKQRILITVTTVLSAVLLVGCSEKVYRGNYWEDGVVVGKSHTPDGSHFIYHTVFGANGQVTTQPIYISIPARWWVSVESKHCRIDKDSKQLFDSFQINEKVRVSYYEVYEIDDGKTNFCGYEVAGITKK